MKLPTVQFCLVVVTLVLNINIIFRSLSGLFFPQNDGLNFKPILYYKLNYTSVYFRLECI